MARSKETKAADRTKVSLAKSGAHVDLPDDVVRESMAIVKKIIGPITAVADLLSGEIEAIGQYLKLRHAIRLARAIENARVYASEGGTSIDNISEKFFIPWAQKVILEEDKNLSNMWSKLLFNASKNDSDEQIFFIEILSRLNTHQAKLLRMMWHKSKDNNEKYDNIYALNNDSAGSLTRFFEIYRKAFDNYADSQFKITLPRTDDDLRESLENFCKEYAILDMSHIKNDSKIYMKAFGYSILYTLEVDQNLIDSDGNYFASPLLFTSSGDASLLAHIDINDVYNNIKTINILAGMQLVTIEKYFQSYNDDDNIAAIDLAWAQLTPLGKQFLIACDGIKKADDEDA